MMNRQTHPLRSHALSRPTEARIREYAYHLYSNRGCKDGHDLEDWYEAEKRLCAEANNYQPGVARLHRLTSRPVR